MDNTTARAGLESPRDGGTNKITQRGKFLRRRLLALLRPLLEAYVRGHWLQTRATPELAHRALDGGRFPGMDAMIGKLPGDSDDADQHQMQKLLHDYVHGGSVQIFSRLGTGGVGSRYGLSLMSSALLAADLLGLSSAMLIGFAHPDGRAFAMECRERRRMIAVAAA